ncbi:NAD(P)-dependent dehydrogenase (short-subunit alcohol dehydrogenase family) [Mumia flava]|uniref:NAD(P)-dependent dehydrogenase (Short-subunit alcohol dehydrogenase family) n=1 Tax=Mumia flava TaxID=1348852 RepID=A0A0B2BLP1_9ACTN|nr:SDR family oxidoreductase [Mumia flava]PJJ54238.1 NAD(P)-dependent dehydrogenase (short-subunit alcohol dehydrogenase family) [Mumia flava]
MDPITIVTGGTRGIGASVARRLATEGHTLVLGYAHDDGAARDLSDELTEQTPVRLVRSDITTDRGVEALYEAAAELGEVTGLVNNAGATLHLGTLATTPTATVRAVVDLNLTAAVLCARRAVIAFEEAGTPGTIVNVSSVAAATGSPGEYVHYAAAKAGIDALTYGLAKETAALGIRVVGVAPGMVETRIHADAGDPDRLERLAGRIPMGRVGVPDDIASAIAWLLTDEASYITGTTLRVAGGL